MRKSSLLRGTRRDVPKDSEELHYGSKPKAVKEAVWKRGEGRCQWCGTQGTPENPIQCDHMHSWSLGGENTVENLELLCRKHDLEKGARVYVGLGRERWRLVARGFGGGS